MLGQTASTGADGWTIAAFVLGVVGTASGVAALVWNIVAHRLTGGRPVVTLRGGWVRGRTFASVTLSSFTSGNPPAEGASPVLIVDVANRGRTPITVTSCSIGFGETVRTGSVGDHRNPATPARIEAGGELSWFFDLPDVLEVFDLAIAQGKGGTVRGVAMIAGRNKDVTSRGGVNGEALRAIAEANS